MQNETCPFSWLVFYRRGKLGLFLWPVIMYFKSCICWSNCKNGFNGHDWYDADADLWSASRGWFISYTVQQLITCGVLSVYNECIKQLNITILQPPFLSRAQVNSLRTTSIFNCNLCISDKFIFCTSYLLKGQEAIISDTSFNLEMKLIMMKPRI